MWHEKLGTFLIVITLTGLIWFFADRSNIDTQKIKLSVKVQPASSIVVLAQTPAKLDFDVMVSAPRGVLNEIIKQHQGQPLQGTLVLGENVGTGLQEFDARKTLAQLEVIQQRGLTINSVEPKVFTLDIDKLVRLPSVRIKPEFGTLLVEADEPNPSTCSVTLPQRLAGDLAGEVLRVDASRYVDASQPNTWVPRTIDLRWPSAAAGSQYVSFSPQTFNLKLRLQDTTKTRRFESVEVKCVGMLDILDRYRIRPLDLTEWRPTIVVSGPRQRIDSLQKDEIRLSVEIFPDDANNVGKPIPRSVTVGLPPGVQLESPRPEVRFVLEDRSTAAATSG